MKDGLTREEILDFAIRDFKDVREELKGPGKLLGYLAMQQKIRKVHDLFVPRDLVHAVMYTRNQDLDLLKRRVPWTQGQEGEGEF